MELLYLGFYLPTNLVARHPQLNGAGQLWESRLLHNLHINSVIRTVSILDRKIQLEKSDHENPNHYFLQGKFSKDIQAPLSFSDLREKYIAWRKQGWKPECFFVYNSHPIGNAFVRFLAKNDPDIKRILFFLDSKYFGEEIGFFKRLRLRLKPFHWFDEAMIPYFHGIASASFSSKRFCDDRHIPWHWFPGGAQADDLLENVGSPNMDGIKQIGYFGSHSDYAGLRELIDAFKNNANLPLTLSIAGEGSQTKELQESTASDPRIQWVGFFNERRDLGQWASSCHVFVNPRPSGYGNENNFPSKVFDYMQLGRCVLSSVTPTLKHAFGDSMIWYDAKHPQALSKALVDISEMSTTDLLRKGEVLREKYSQDYSWSGTVNNLKDWIRNL
jgi:glycosyltransferase involved in cell wall biosynthesis